MNHLSENAKENFNKKENSKDAMISTLSNKLKDENRPWETDQTLTEEEFLKQYNPKAYDSPAVTADILIFTINREQKLQLLLIQRGRHPFKGKWAVPGGFVEMDESLDQAAARELKEETGLEDIYLEQLYTFGAVDRDARTRVISVAYIALVPARRLDYRAGDDAADACLFDVEYTERGFQLICAQKDLVLTQEDLAFDHKDIVEKGLERLRGKVTYSDIALELLKDKEKFTIYELQKINEAITGEKMDIANFRRAFKRKYIDTGRVKKLLEKCVEHSKKPSSYYQMLQPKE